MRWRKLHSPFPEITIIGTKIGAYSFVITTGSDGNRASWQKNEWVGKTSPHEVDGNPFETLTSAKEACSQVWKQLRAKQ